MTDTTVYAVPDHPLNVSAGPLPTCPFCDKPPVVLSEVDLIDNYERGITIRCDECGIEITDEYRSEVEKRWRTRGDDPEGARNLIRDMADHLDGALGASTRKVSDSHALWLRAQQFLGELPSASQLGDDI